MDFQLKELDPSHDFFARIGLTIETVSKFGLGYCRRGMLKGQIAIPIHDLQGTHIGYAGADVNAKSGGAPGYAFPTSRVRQGRRMEFRKELLLYNHHRVKAPRDDLIVVRDFRSLWWLHQCGFPHCVALMADSCAPEQLKLLLEAVNPTGKVVLVLDREEQNESLGAYLVNEIAPRRFVRWHQLPKTKQLYDLSLSEVQNLLTW